MAARDPVRPRTSIVETNCTLGTKPRDPPEDRPGADSEIPGYRCRHLAAYDPGNDKRAAVRAGVGVGVQLHDRHPFSRRRPLRSQPDRPIKQLCAPRYGTSSKEKLADPFDGMIGQLGEDVGEPSLWINVVELGGLDQGIDGGNAPTANRSGGTMALISRSIANRASMRSTASIAIGAFCSRARLKNFRRAIVGQI
jgi:hypothetical protein